MLRGFRRARDGRVLLVVEDQERAILAVLLESLMALVAPPEPDPDEDPLSQLVGIDDAAVTPDDPGLARLLPDAYPDDPAASEDFRRFTQRSLREGKLVNARTARETLDRAEPALSLSADEAQCWLLALNDLRLDLGTRLDISEDEQDLLDGLAEDNPMAPMFAVYDWLTWLQDSLVRALSAG